jgi:LysR family transcriptional regulator (chromosome initiation inhibitor)
MHIDYDRLAALAAVVREGSFERAAGALHVTPSAVSQRIRALEETCGTVLVVRGSPCEPTAAGRLLCRHAERVAALEHELRPLLPHAGGGDTAGAAPTLRVAVNADSLATWFLPAAARACADGAMLLDLVAEDQDHTADALRRGEVLGAVTSLASPVQGCRSLRLGRLRYRACASPGFVVRHFAGGVDARGLSRAPSLRFNRKDALQSRWARALLGRAVELPCHWMPSSTAFVDAAGLGLGWGLCPESLVEGPLREGRLVELVPGRPLDVPLHWQHVRLATPSLDRLTAAVLGAAERSLDREPALTRAPRRPRA